MTRASVQGGTDSAGNTEARAGESEAERVDRNFDDLLQELRVSQNGTQILFAFLLTVPFSNGFRHVTAFQRGLYFATLLMAALSAAMLIAPAVMHRIVFRQHMKEQLLLIAGRIALGGQALLTLTVAGAVWLIGDYLYGVVVGVVLAVLMLAWWGLWFFALPVRMRAHHRRTGTT
jgi:hypothetical protein